MAVPYYVSALNSGYVWANNKTGVTLTYTFWNSLPSYYSSYDDEARSFQPFTAAMKDAVRDVLAQVSSICNITFQEVAPSSSAQLGYAQAYLGSGTAAWAYYPGTTFGGDVWSNNLYDDSHDVAHGDFGFATLLHETGHALGLKHSFEGSSRLIGAEDTSRYTVMSYTDVFNAESYMLYDIAALQHLYGANMTYHAGNDTYALLSGHAYTIWDAGGADTLDGSAMTGGLKLNLNAGKFSSVGLTDNIAIAYNVTIENANGGSGSDTIWDNTAGNTIRGNGGNDTIYGGAGNDYFDGGLGTDTLIYTVAQTSFTFTLVDSVTLLAVSTTMGSDTWTNFESFSFSNGVFSFAQLEAMAGSGDTDPNPDPDPDPPPATGDLVLTGDAYANALMGDTGNDTLNGLGGSDTLRGMDGSDLLDGGFGTDRMFGGFGDDVYYADLRGDAMTELAGQGTDTVHAFYGLTLALNIENLVLEGTVLNGTGNGLNNALTGNASGNFLYGVNGDDVLDGGLGNDTLTGGRGADTFIFLGATAGGIDSVADFRVAQGDSLDISDLLTGYDPLADVLTDFVDMRTVGSSTQVWVDADGAGTAAGFTQVAVLRGVTGLSNEADDVARGLLVVS
ncbi:MAG: M10 family metallopeptidase C-terminal domain-containing protein [Alphaproteobacteria bacterium]